MIQDLSKTNCIHDAFQRQAQRTPDAVAVVFRDERVTYRELDARADRLAALLCELGVGIETLVGICLERSVGMIVAMIAVLKAGAAYVPLDPAYPRERLAFIIGDARMPVLLTQCALADSLSGCDAKVICVDAQPERESLPREIPKAAAPNLAYVIYTSGSTGRPKGVAIEHRNTLALLEWARTVFDRRDLAGVLASTSICFDLSVFELFLPLVCGGKVILAANALELPSLPARDEVTLINTVPSAIAELVRTGGIPASVRTVNLAGEPLSQRLVQEIYRQETIGRVFDLYGPSETTTYSTFALRKADAPATIGRAIRGTKIHLLGEKLQPVPHGEPGEIHIGGAGVARGYWNRPELTAEKFIPDPFSDDPAARLYRTGDVARTMPDGNLEYLGRIDHQVKIRGFRIELGEIETVLAQHASVREAVVLAREKAAGDKRLVAYLVHHADAPADAPVLRSFLRQKLPDYMVPATFVVLGAFPRTPNGKLDRKALPAPDWERGDARDATDLPRTATEVMLAGIWCAVLGIGLAGPDDNFFELGGHSLLATRVTSRVRELFRAEISLRTFFENPTVRALAAHIDHTREAAPQRLLPPIVPVPRAPAMPLSFAQERLWFMDRLEPERAVYNVAMALRLDGALNPDTCRRCLDEIVRRHESLRTNFDEVDGTPVQRIAAPGPIELPCAEPSEITEVWRWCEEEARRPFDLSAGPLLRARLFRLSPEKYVLFLNVHHIVMDDWSASVLVAELNALYAAFAAGRPSPLAPLPVQYADFAAGQRESISAEMLGTQLAYWKQQLDGAPALLELPADHPRPAVQSHAGAVERVLFPKSLHGALTALSQQEGASFFMLVLAAFDVLLSRISGQEDIVVGSPIAGRNRAEIENLIGFFVNTLALRCDLSGDPTFRDVLARVRDTTLGAYANQDVPFEKLVEELRPARNLSHSPLCQVIFALQHLPLAQHADGLRVGLEWIPTGTAKFDLTVTMIERADGLEAMVEYSTDLFERDTIVRLLGCFGTLLEGIVADPAARIATLPLMTPAERALSLVEWNRTESAYPRECCIHELFEAHATRAPDAVAVVFGGRQITYRALDEQANRIANVLRKRGVGPDVLVGLCVERSPELIAGLLGILKAGGAYIPLDPSYPAERLAFMIADAALQIVLTSRWTSTVVEAQRICIDVASEEIANEPATKPATNVQPDHLAYVIFTSGSTGQAKGVLVPHRGLCNVAEAQSQAFQPAPGDRVLQFASISFDASIFEIVMALSHGAALCLGSQDELMPGPGLVRFLCENEVSIVTLTPSALAVLPFVELPALRVVTVAGEACSAALVNQWAPGRKFFNLYGPTETTIWATIAECPAGEGAPAIGRPIANTHAYVLDRQLAPLPVGVVGELFISGEGVARGYLNRPDLTAERFVSNPFHDEPGARLYRTGDLVRQRADGTLEFRGRADQQVKIRGFRVELGEIESVLRQHCAVSEAVVVAAPDGQRLAAYIVAAESRVPSASELQTFLRAKLPEYLVPATFTTLAALPLTPSGKSDRRALPAPDATPDLRGEYVPPATPTEERLARIWSAVLRVERVGVQDNFFALGGHSLLAGQLASRLRDELKSEVPLRSVFENQTVRALAKSIDGLPAEASGAPPLVRAARTGPLQLSFAQERLWFLDQLEPDSALYNVAMTMRLDGALDPAVLQRCLDEIVRRHESLRTNFTLTDGQPAQSIADATPADLRCLDLSMLPERERAAESACQCEDEARRSFDLARDRLLRAQLFRLVSDAHLLFVNVHHIAMDEWSAGVLMDELVALYAAFSAGRPSPLAEPPVQYADFAVWQREWLRGARLDKQLAYWRERLADAPALFELPADRARPAVQTHRGALETAHFPGPLAEALRALSREEGVSLFMLALAAFQVLLSRLSGRDDIVIGSPSASRHRTEIEGLIGFFVNLLVLRCDLSGDPTFREMLSRVREITLGAFAHQDLPFEKLVEELKPARNLSYSPLCQVIFALQNLPAEQPAGALRVALEWVPTGTAKFDLSVTMIETREGLKVMAEYSTDLFDRGTIAGLLDRFRILLEGIVANPRQRISALPLMSDAERVRVLVEWNRTESVEPRECCIHELFEAQAQRTPEAVALVFEEQRLTFRELDTRANRVAAILRARGVGPEVLVGLCIERSLEMIVGLLGILKAGGAYVPLEPAFPAARLKLLLDDCNAAILLTQRELLDGLPALRCAVVCIDDTGASAPLTEICAKPSNLAYVIYTSGSTGGPKPVAIEHRQIVNYVRGIIERVKFGAGWSFATASALTADLGNTVIFPALCTGGSLHIIARERVADPIAFADYFNRHRIDCLKIVPSHLAALQSGPHPERVMPRRCLILGGEPSRCDWVESLQALAPECAIFNHYGPTETTVGVLTYRLRGKPPAGISGTLPMGRPLAHTRIYILDHRGKPVPPGVSGEIYIGGSSVGRGYLRRAELTAERFVPDPFIEATDARLYRTGDRARFLADGNVEFLGRLDEQVKVRGFRIEPAEIEATLASHPLVRRAAVVTRENPGGETVLLAFFEPDTSTKVSAAMLRTHLREHLPEYMIPGGFVPLENLPLTSAGKVDRQALLSAPVTDEREPAQISLPVSQLEVQLVRIWQEALGVGPVGVQDNFFDLGGHSLLAARIVSEIRRTLGVQAPIATLFLHPTIEKLARALPRGPEVEAGAFIHLQTGSSPGKLIFIISEFGMQLMHLASMLGGTQPKFASVSPFSTEVIHAMAAGRRNGLPGVEDLADKHAEQIIGNHHGGRCILAGYCFDGVLAVEVVRRLESRGIPVECVFLFETGLVLGPREWRFLLRSWKMWARRNLAFTVRYGPRYLWNKLKGKLARSSRYSLTAERAARLRRESIDQADIVARVDVVRKICRNAQRNYHLRPVASRAVLFLSSDGLGISEDPSLGACGVFTGGVEIVPVGGNHATMLQEPHLRTLVAEVARRLTLEDR